MLVHVEIATGLKNRVHSVERRTTLAGFDFPSFMQRMIAEEQPPRNKEQMLTLLRENGESWAKRLDSLSDNSWPSASACRPA